MTSRGGYRQPGSPAPASGPGSLARRTDGGPADRQPMRVPPGLDYGERQEVEQIQRGAPMAVDQPLPGAAAQTLPATGHPEAFGPTLRPGERGDAGIGGDRRLPVADVLAELDRLYPSPWLQMMMERARSGGR